VLWRDTKRFEARVRRSLKYGFVVRSSLGPMFVRRGVLSPSPERCPHLQAPVLSMRCGSFLLERHYDGPSGATSPHTADRPGFESLMLQLVWRCVEEREAMRGEWLEQVVEGG
jgi:hypothetical protein